MHPLAARNDSRHSQVGSEFSVGAAVVLASGDHALDIDARHQRPRSNALNQVVDAIHAADPEVEDLVGAGIVANPVG